MAFVERTQRRANLGATRYTSNRAFVVDVRTVRFDNRRCNDGNCPALVLGGEHDPWVLPAEARSVAQALRGPAQCVIFPNASHGGYWWAAVVEYRKILGAWLDATLSQRPR